MTDPDDIKKQTDVESKDLDPEAAGEELDKLEDEALEDVSGGRRVRPYADQWSPEATIGKTGK